MRLPSQSDQTGICGKGDGIVRLYGAGTCKPEFWEHVCGKSSAGYNREYRGRYGICGNAHVLSDKEEGCEKGLNGETELGSGKRRMQWELSESEPEGEGEESIRAADASCG